jgi:hypothetical protein
MSLGCTGALRDASVGIRLVVASISTRLMASSNIRRSRSKSDLLNRRHVQLNQRNTVSPAAVHAAKSATEAIPILADDLENDPISSGFVASLAHPGRNIPGVFSDFPDFSMKCAMKEFRVAEPAAGDETHPCRLWARSSRRQMCVAHQHHAKSSRGADFGANLSICHHTHDDTAAALQCLAHIDCYRSKSVRACDE